MIYTVAIASGVLGAVLFYPEGQPLQMLYGYVIGAIIMWMTDDGI